MPKTKRLPSALTDEQRIAALSSLQVTTMKKTSQGDIEADVRVIISATCQTLYNVGMTINAGDKALANGFVELVLTQALQQVRDANKKPGKEVEHGE